MAKLKLNPELFEVTWHDLGRGIRMMCCWTPQCPKPIGHIFFIQVGKSRQTKKSRADILHSYVEPWARRQGVRTFLQSMLFQYWKPDVVISQSGTTYGDPWMRARGYKVHDELGFWYVTREAFEASLKAR